MGLTVDTAPQYCNELYKRVGVESREQLMTRFLAGGILSRPTGQGSGQGRVNGAGPT